MFILGNLLIAAAKILNILLFWAYILILVRAVISWVNPDPFNPVVQFLYRMTEPMLIPVRKRLPAGRIDFSPIIVFLIIIFLQNFLVVSIEELGYNMKRSASKSPTVIGLESFKPDEDEKFAY